MKEELEERLINIETALACQEKELDDLNQVVIAQGKELEALRRQVKLMFESMSQDTVKPLSEETPPPHY